MKKLTPSKRIMKKLTPQTKRLLPDFKMSSDKKKFNKDDVIIRFNQSIECKYIYSSANIVTLTGEITIGNKSYSSGLVRVTNKYFWSNTEEVKNMIYKRLEDAMNGEK